MKRMVIESYSVLLVLYHLVACLAHSPNSQSGHTHAPHTDGGRVDIDPEHIKEHLDGVADMADDMSQEELEFHYFKLHDIDNNTRLDGLEIYNALSHYMDYDSLEPQHKTVIDKTGKTAAQIEKEERQASENYYSAIVDELLLHDDINHDGYITYLEFVLAKRRAENEQQATQRHP